MAKKVTIFGAGLVVKPMVDYLAKNGFEVVIASRTLSKAEKLAAPHEKATAIQFVANDMEQMADLIKESDLVVSLLPATLHVEVAKKCIELKTNMVTTSYISPQMRELDAAAKEAGIMILNEIGVDPGIDHMSAMKIFHEVEEKGGKIVSFMSYCGGLPAHQDNTNPWGYKFSWAPKGVLKAAGNNARYMKDGKIIEVPGKNLFSHYWFLDVEGAGTFEAYVNRDSLPYIDLYSLKDVRTMYRGTLRNVSHCDTWFILSQMGFFNDDDYYNNLSGTVQEFVLEKVLGASKDACLKEEIVKRYGILENSVILKKFEWLGIIGDTPMPIKEGSAVDVLTALMLEKMSYDKGERDLLVLHHEFVAAFGDKEQRITSTMIDTGIENGDSSMSRTVSLPAAIAVRYILEGKFFVPGVHMPVMPEVYLPVLEELGNLDIKVIERFYD